MTNREKIFFVFFLPLFALKLLDITSGNIVLTAASGVCLLFAIGSMLRDSFRVDYAKVMISMLLYTVLLVFTSGKTGVFFSTIFLILLKDIEPNHKVYKYSFWIGLLFLLIACYLGKNGGEAERFINGEWTTMVKRSNLLYVSFTAVLSLYLLIKRNILTNKHILSMVILNYLMFLYVGSRTGFLSVLVLLLLLLLFHNTRYSKNRIIYWGCMMSPLVSFIFSIATGILYGKYPIIDYLDMSFQGRIYQEFMYYNRYPINLFGQHLYEGDKVDFWNLDCAYWDILLNLGLIYTVIWLYVSIIVIKYFYKRGQMVEVSILVMYSIYGISETFLPNCFLNMSFFLYAECLYSKYGSRRRLSNQ